MNNPYENIDKQLIQLKREVQKEFNKTRLRLLGFDETNLLKNTKNEIKRLYQKIADKTVKMYFTNAKELYHGLTKSVLNEWLDAYYIVTGYVFYNEFLRKQARYYETIMSFVNEKKSLSNADVIKAQKRAVNLLNGQIEDYAIYVMDNANLEQLRIDGYKKVRWITQKDEFVCEKCSSKNNEVYDIDKAPPKEHNYCRCYYVGVK